MTKHLKEPSIIYEKETGEGSQVQYSLGYTASPAYVKWLEANVILGDYDAHVICCNDSVERVIIGDLGRAEKIKAETSRANYDAYVASNGKEFENYSDYQKRMFWHIHTVKGSRA